MRFALSSCTLSVLTLVGLSCGPRTVPPSLAHSLENAHAPEFHELATSSWDVGLPATPSTKVTVVDFWASWCDECQRTMPALEQLYRDKKDDGLMVIGVSVDKSADDANSAALGMHATFPIVLDPSMQIMQRYRVANIPLSFVVDRKGSVRWIGRDPDDLRRAVLAVLSE